MLFQRYGDLTGEEAFLKIVGPSREIAREAFERCQEEGFGCSIRIVRGCQDEGSDSPEHHELTNSRAAVTSEVVDRLCSAHRVSDQHHVAQIERVDHLCEIVGRRSPNTRLPTR